MSSSASCTDPGRPGSPHATGRARNRFERAIARVLVVAMIGMSPGSAFAGEEFGSADDAVMQTPGSIDNSVAGETTIDSLADQGLTDWAGGLEQPAGHTLYINQPGVDSTHTNTVGGGFTAHLDGTLISNGNVVIASPFGVFIGNEAVLDVGSLVAVGGRLPIDDFSNQLTLDLTAPVENRGLIRADRNVLLYGTHVRNEGQISLGTGELLMLGGDSVHFLDPESVTEALLNPTDFVAILGSGSVENHGQINAPAAALMGRRVANYGEIAIADGSLMMLGADAVYVSQFDNPVLVRLPHDTSSAYLQGEEMDASDPEYAVENHGTIDAGLGHVRLAASDPLGWGIRQGAGNGDRRPSIAARRIEIDGGEGSRVAISGDIDASAPEDGEVGGEIDITGSVIALNDAQIEASGNAGGGVIHIGGEQQGGGDLQRARVLSVDEASAVRADALEDGDGGRVILFSEDLTSIAGQLSARGGEQGGDGGFIETSGLRHFHITQTPDAAAPAGDAGDWLIDPYSIRIRPDSPDPDFCRDVACLNDAVEAILAPNFDGAAFDDILRTVTQDPFDADPSLNDLSVDLLIRALAVGTNITLSTEAFNSLDGDEAEGLGVEPGRPTSNGDITIDAPIAIDDAGTLEGTRARLTLLAAGSIYVNEDIIVGDGDATTTSDMSLSLEFRANDQSQRSPSRVFDTDMLRGNVVLADGVEIITGGGDFIASGISFLMQSTESSIETSGGDVQITTGSLDAQHLPDTYIRTSANPEAYPSPSSPTDSLDPSIQIAGTIDTATPDDEPSDGGDILLAANGVTVRTSQEGRPLLQVDQGSVVLTGTLRSDGGDISLSAGNSDNNFAGRLMIDGTGVSGPIIDSSGGDIRLDAQRVDPESISSSFDVELIDSTPGGTIEILTGSNALAEDGIRTFGGTLAIGTAATQKVEIDGILDTRDSNNPGGPEDGLLTIVANDSSALSSDEFGSGVVLIGTGAGPTELTSAGISIEAREVVTSSSLGSTTITAEGETTASILESTLGIDSDPDDQANPSFANEGEVVINGDRNIRFDANTSITAESIQITAASDPAELSDSEKMDADVFNRLDFKGVGGDGPGVRLSGDEIAIFVGDGTTATAGLTYEDPGTPGNPTEFGLERGSQGDYAGLQLRDRLGDSRPETVTIQQDGDLKLTGEDEATEATAAVLDLGANGAFGDADIGAEGQLLTFESSDGVLTIDSAEGLNSQGTLLSSVVLNGGLLLDDTNGNDPMDWIPFGSNLPADSLDLESLTLTTPRNLTIDSGIASAIGTVTELVFQAGRNTGVDDAAVDGTLTVATGTTLQASDRIALLAGASGFGDLVFESGVTTTIATDEIELRAGAGPDSLNTGAEDQSRIIGIRSDTGAEVAFRTGSGGDFVSDGSTELSFEFRQDFRVDSDEDLPEFDNFSSEGIDSFDGGSSGEPVRYAVRSDKGIIDLKGDALGGDRFKGAGLSLIGFQTEDSAAIQVDEGFRFEGPTIELGGVTNFAFTQALAAAFNPPVVVDDDPTKRERVTLRAGLNDTGALSFAPGGESSVTVAAGRIELIASAGSGGAGVSNVQTEFVTFDLSGGAEGERTFVFQQERDLQPFELPERSQFINGLPNILALRNDTGSISSSNFDLATLPLDLNTPGRLILEADTILLSQTLGGDLELTSDQGDLANMRLRLRANTLQLEASTSNADIPYARVLLGQRDEDDPPPVGNHPDADYTSQRILIEGFDEAAEIASTNNLSALSEVEDEPGMYNLEFGLGPTTITIDQDGAVTPDELPQRLAIAGYLERSTATEEDDEPIPTNYAISSPQSSITLTPENVSGSDLLVGNSSAPTTEDIRFDFGVSGDYAFENVAVYGGESVFVSSGVRMSATDTILLAAAVPLTQFQPSEAILPGTDTAMGDLVFEGVGTTTLAANQITLSAGSNGTVTNPDGTIGDTDGQRDTIAQLALAEVDLRGLRSVERLGNIETSLLTVRQSRSLVSSKIATALLVGLYPSAGEWETVDLSSIQGVLVVPGLQFLSLATRNLTLGRARSDATVAVFTDLSDPFADPEGLDGFEGQVRIESNDVTFRPLGPTANLILNAPRLRLVSDTIVTGTGIFDDEGRLRTDLDENGAPLRPIVRVVQPGDFTSTLLPRPDRYFRIPLAIERDSTEQRRDSLSDIDIELTTTGSELILGDEVRERTSFSNLILRTSSLTANITVDFDSLTPGYDTYDFAAPDIDRFDFAALQLTSLEVQANRLILDGTITIAPFILDPADGTPADLTITTMGDQRFGGDVALQQTLSTTGREIRFTGDVYRDGSIDTGPDARPDAGLIVESRGQVFFEENIGVDDDLTSLDSALGKLWLLFDSDTRFGTPSVQFGKRIDRDGDGVDETPLYSDQLVVVDGDIVFAAIALDDPNNPQDPEDGNRVDDFQDAIEMSENLGNIANALERFDIGRIDPSHYATIGKSRGNLTFDSLDQYSHFIMGSGERLSVGGNLQINAVGDVVTLGDVGALDIEVDANQIGFVRRDAGVTRLPDGSSSQDAGSVILANTIDFGGATLAEIGRGKAPRFGVENPYDPTLPSYLDAFGVFANTTNGGLLSPGSFDFDPSSDSAGLVASLLPAGASRSELTGAYGPRFLPTPTPLIREAPPLRDPQRMMELDVDAYPISNEIMLARLEGAAIIDDVGRVSYDDTARVSDARLDEADSELAIALHEELFGADGDRAGEVRAILQYALDRYLETTRARRVIGFELRRFVKNRPSSLLEAYTTLDELDSLFRYHRRLGLSPGEYKRIQHVWLENIQPDGITLDELSEAIHPSRYVRGSDILDIFGR